ncbi:hypothetical protein CDAR_217841 [Caerostris darwini]|uniref:Uncharacterized protein n=1 Tax=Caerostris darwini TaxID=1538125 RepID=A0AAV4SAX6_9ARAC|nr:hypothetical protein CDAR_217841 [Caerostris darwini]
MSLQQREICKVGESPSARRRSISPRRGSGQSANEENPDQPGIEHSSDTSKSFKLTSSPSSSGCTNPEVRSPSKSERRISTRLLMQKGEAKVDSPGKNKSSKHAAWKSSKFFSRSMASGELLKGFKKLSTATPVTSIVVSEEDGTSTTITTETKEVDTKTFKSRFSSLRRKSGSDSDSVPNVDSE